MRTLPGALLIVLTLVAYANNHHTNTLTNKEISDGWLLLFDGETTFGWTSDAGNLLVKDGALVLTGEQRQSSMMPTSRFNSFELTADFQLRGKAPIGAITLECGEHGTSRIDLKGSQGSSLRLFVVADQTKDGISSQLTMQSTTGKKWNIDGILIHDGTRKGYCPPLVFSIETKDAELVLRNIKLRPLRSDSALKLPADLEPENPKVAGLTSIFNGKDLTGWKVIPDRKSKFSVTRDGELSIKDGPGDIQTEGQWDDFILQLDIKTKGNHLNSGVFFRTLPGRFWSGYESQIRNQWQGEDRTKPVDFGTGGIYNRQPARKVVSSDNEWFTKTVVAQGNHIAVWVNGYQVSDFTDQRPPNDNARKGTKLGEGPISFQGHDPTTDLSFRNIRVATLPKP